MNDIRDINQIELLSGLPEMNPDCVLIVNLDCRILYSNPGTNCYLTNIFPEINNAQVKSILPTDINIILLDMENNEIINKNFDYKISDTFLKCKIVKSAEKNLYHIYINSITQAKNISNYDPVTQLPNVIYLNEIVSDEIYRCKILGSNLSLVILNIINYKNLSYALGYQFGERLLQSISEKLKSVFNKGEIIAKYSDNNYAIVLPQVSLRAASVKAGTIIELFDSPFIISDLRIEIDVCIGIADFPKHGADAHSILQCADVAMNKAHKTNSLIESYDKHFFEETTKKIKLATELHRALATDELSVVYQPKVDIKSNLVIGVEALMRWMHPQEGYISPDVFIEVAEQSRLIKEITIWVLNRSLKDYSQLDKVSPNIKLSVNITVRDLTSESFPEIVAGLLAAWKVPASVLILEITENALISDTEQVLSVMSRLSNIGVHLSIDDFGTGYSSLNYLRQLNVNELKIDKSFVMDMLEDENDQIIVRAVTSLAHDLNLIVTAEGVESEEILLELKKYQCDIAQGYHLSKPLGLSYVIEWIRNYR
ncbi:diguanylate cyclase/phosphodiesterase (GGDEF & EAL domains) with PAS/PAC sensor(s) [hydrothermal vent metagenome]|uniref:Diguanylate cyclase/phosphodiesterase (GGDEF & EAL domains) with PAS/PAC sensor(S) n=1 Tax=hydrothermal vent metagenome TaxID=652676 RepID=A0A3B1APL6_9ZZZZ